MLYTFVPHQTRRIYVINSYVVVYTVNIGDKVDEYVIVHDNNTHRRCCFSVVLDNMYLYLFVSAVR